jgi:chromosome segregation ATPase
MRDDLLALARDLERRDADLARRISAATELLQRVDSVRGRGRELQAALLAIPAEIAHAEEVERDARTREADVRLELVEAERRLDEAGRSRRAGEDVMVAAERAARRAAVAVEDAAATVAGMRDRLEGLVRVEAALQAEGEGLAVEARHAAAAVAELPRVSESGRSVPGASLVEVEEWGARAHAALFVVRGGLENERERIVFEANSLAAAALGDHAGGASVALVLKRLEESRVDA